MRNESIAQLQVVFHQVPQWQDRQVRLTAEQLQGNLASVLRRSRLQKDKGVMDVLTKKTKDATTTEESFRNKAAQTITGDFLEILDAPRYDDDFGSRYREHLKEDLQVFNIEQLFNPNRAPISYLFLRRWRKRIAATVARDLLRQTAGERGVNLESDHQEESSSNGSFQRSTDTFWQIGGDHSIIFENGPRGIVRKVTYIR